MHRFKTWNRIGGWLVFVISALVYLLTLEPTASFWDCGEFIATAYKLQVGHPPGAPFYLLLAKVFSLFAADKAHVAIWINGLSAISSAFTIMFLFFTITMLARKIIVKSVLDYSESNLMLILGAGFVGSLAYTFSDTFWFSAVEAEVYAQSSLFTAVVFWAILKWEEQADQPYANRWLILIFYLMGLSVGVHLLNLLAIPAIAQVYYFRKYRYSFRGFIISLMLSILILWFVHFMIIPGSVKLAIWSEFLFVNGFGLPYNTGIIFYGVLLVAFIVCGLWLSYKYRKVLVHTLLLSLTVFLIGYSSYTLIVIRANAGTSINENNPGNVISLLGYLNREQYGDDPLFYGPYYNAPVTGYINGTPTYGRENGKYEVWSHDVDYKFDSRFCTVFPRMYSRNASHINIYKEWVDIKGTPIAVTKNGKVETIVKPSFADNLTFFAKYQVGYMYFRYFLWNFAGKQNDYQGNGGIIKGNFITGISFIDDYFYGDQDKLPSSSKKAKGRNIYYCLPLLLGILGMLYHFFKRKRDGWIVFLLFIMTGLAIVVYLNQTPLQVRERDYAYAGSFYAFAIWVGLGLLALHQFIRKIIKKNYTPLIAISLAFAGAPLLMAFQNWDDHDRSGRFIAHDVAYNYLNSCAPNAILFTNGDNDTFPLWYLQEVEGVRTDVRVVNLVLLGTDWYIEQMKKQSYDSAPLPIRFSFNQIRDGVRDFVYLIEEKADTLALNSAVAFVASENAATKFGEDADAYFPSRIFALKMNKDSLLKAGFLAPHYADSVPSAICFRINRGYIAKSDLMVLDILAGNNWKRPVYYTSLNHNGAFGLEKYIRQEGYAYRLLPVPARYVSKGLNSRVLYTNLMDTFKWGRMNEPGVLIDDHIRRTLSLLRFRQIFANCANQLYSEGKADSAKRIIRQCISLTEPSVISHDRYSIDLADACYKMGDARLGDSIIIAYSNQSAEELAFYQSMPLRLLKLVIYEKAMAEQSIERMLEVTTLYKRDKLSQKLKAYLEKYQLK
ncbi:MAG TPA: DUF2723 domain-containing protein [Bacteroidales bacterium]|nr:DUF2723 domain-containing protein [Bacteroidales bacterium]